MKTVLQDIYSDVSRQKVPSAATLQLHSFQFDDFSLQDSDMLKVSFKLEAIVANKSDISLERNLEIILIFPGLSSHVYRP